MKVAIYSRVSTHDQDEQLQVPRLRDFCNRLGYEIYKEYSDVASGKNANRPGWKALLSDARRREFDAVIVVKLDRIMRSLTQLLDILNDFEKRRISIITLDHVCYRGKIWNGSTVFSTSCWGSRRNRNDYLGDRGHPEEESQ